MLFPMSETFKKSQMSEFFDVSAGCFPSNRFRLSLAVKSTRSLPRETLVSYYATPNDNLML